MGLPFRSMSMFSYRNADSIRFCPSAFNSAQDDSAISVQVPSPFCKAKSDTIMGYPACSSGILLLLLSCCPIAVFWAISFIVVSSFKSQPEWTQTHIRKEIIERLPAFANSNPSATIIKEGLGFRISTSLNHAVPCSIYFRAGHVMSNAMKIFSDTIGFSHDLFLVQGRLWLGASHMFHHVAGSVFVA